MSKQLPILTSAVVLTACNSDKVTIIDQVMDRDVVGFCAEYTKCGDGEIYQEYELAACVDAIRDRRHKSVSLGCESEFNELLACEIDELPERSCRSDFEDIAEWEDYREDYENEYYGSFGDCGFYDYISIECIDSMTCNKEAADLEECFLDFEGRSFY